MKSKTKKLSPIYNRLARHDGLCAMNQYSLGDDRHCTCGRDAALEAVAKAREALGEPLATQIFGKNG